MGSDQFESRLFEICIFQLAIPYGKHRRVRDGHRMSQNPKAKRKMGKDLPTKNRPKTHGPHAKQAPNQIARSPNHEKRHRNLHITLRRNIEIIGDHPEHGTGSGAEMPAEQRQQCHQNHIVHADVQENPKAKREHQLGRSFPSAIKQRQPHKGHDK